MAKVKERQFYNVGTGKREMVPADYITMVKFKNGAIAMQGISRDNVKMFKLVSEKKIEKMEDKYGRAKRYRR